jgi:glycine/D-amino acid oxidase-like deaminating enzyme
VALGTGDDQRRLRACLAELRAHGLEASWLEPSDIASRAPVVEGTLYEGGVYCAEDGVVDISGLLQGYLRSATRGGARLLTDRRVLAIGTRSGRVHAVQTHEEDIATETVVNAAGAWAGEIGLLAGATEQPLRPCRRHLALSGPLPWVERSWPIVWDVTNGLYYRPEPPGLLLSACDVTPLRPVRGGTVPSDAEILELLAGKLQRWAPRLSGLRIARYWAGLRTLTPDELFVIGRDPRVGGFVWCAGLGGHGMTVSAAVGRLAAEAVLGEPAAAAFDPGRFADHPAPRARSSSS